MLGLGPTLIGPLCCGESKALEDISHDATDHRPDLRMGPCIRDARAMPSKS